MFACLPVLLVGRKKKFKEDGKNGGSNGDLRVKPIDLSSPSTVKGSSGIPKVQSSDSLARAESIGEASNEGGCSDSIDLRFNRELTSRALYKEEAVKEIASDPGMEQAAFMEEPPLLKRSCSNFEIKQAKRWIKTQLRSSSYSNLQNLPGNGRVRISYESRFSPLSTDRVMLKRWSSSQVLPSRSRKIWWKLFIWSHRNLHKPKPPPIKFSAFIYPKQKDGYLSDTHEPGLRLDKGKKKAMDFGDQWVAFSLRSSRMDRVSAWVNSLEDCSFSSVNFEGVSEGFENEPTFSEKNCCSSNRHAAEEVAQANNVVQSLNTFSSVAHISGIGLKVIPSISAVLCLRSVNLSGNSIAHITAGSLPKSLHTLDLSRNRISTIEGIRDLEKLRILNLSYNRITRIGHGLSSCTVIKELYLAGNKISNVEGLHRLPKLLVLDLSFNKITTNNAVGQLVANYSSLLALDLLGNPILTNAGDDHHIRRAISSLLPHVTFLNKQPFRPHRGRQFVADTVAKAALRGAPLRCRRRSSASCFRESSFRTGNNDKGRLSNSGRKNG